MLDEAALAGEDLGRQLATVLACRRTLRPLHDGRHWAAAIFELLGAVLNGDAGAPANVLVVGALAGVLEPRPTAYVVDQDPGEIRGTVLNILD